MAIVITDHQQAAVLAIVDGITVDWAVLAASMIRSCSCPGSPAPSAGRHSRDDGDRDDDDDDGDDDDNVGNDHSDHGDSDKAGFLAPADTKPSDVTNS